MDSEAIIERVEAAGPQTYHPILRTCRVEIEQTCVLAGRRDLASIAATMPEESVARVALKLGDILMEGGDYWEGIPVAVERAMGV